MLRISSNWLSKKTNKEFRKLNNLTIWQFWKEMHNLNEFLNGPNSYVFIIPIVMILYVLTYFDLSFPKIFIFNRETALEILQSRLINYIVILSITITVFVFIINALNTRRVEEDILPIIIKDSYIYPMLYFSLFNIGILLLLTYTKDANWMSTKVILDSTALFLWLFIINLFFIGRLYYKIFFYLKSYHLNDLQIIDIQNNFKKNLNLELLERLSYKIYIDTYNNEEYGLSLEYFSSKKQADVKKVKLKNAGKKIQDVNLKKLSKILKNRIPDKKNDCMRGIFINKIIYQNESIFYLNDEKTVNALNIALLKIIRFKE